MLAEALLDGSAAMLRRTLLARQEGEEELPHDNYGTHVNAAVWVMTGLAGVFMGLRLYCKSLRRKQMWWDDWILIAAFVMLTVQTSCLSVMVHYGFGKHSWDVTDWYNYMLTALVTGLFSIIAAAWSKTSFAVLLLRFTDGKVRWLLWFVIVSVNLFLGCSALFHWVQCWPTEANWDSRVEAKCWPGHVIVIYNSFSSAWSGVMDILLAILPWRIISKGSLNKKERLGVLIAMSMGVFAGITSIAKTATLSAINNPDVYSSIALMLLATAETALTIIAASIPFLRVLIKNTLSGDSFPEPYHVCPSHTTHTRHGSAATAGSASSPRRHQHHQHQHMHMHLGDQKQRCPCQLQPQRGEFDKYGDFDTKDIFEDPLVSRPARVVSVYRDPEKIEMEAGLSGTTARSGVVDDPDEETRRLGAFRFRLERVESPDEARLPDWK